MDDQDSMTKVEDDPRVMAAYAVQRYRRNVYRVFSRLLPSAVLVILVFMAARYLFFGRDVHAFVEWQSVCALIGVPAGFLNAAVLRLLERRYEDAAKESDAVYDNAFDEAYAAARDARYRTQAQSQARESEEDKDEPASYGYEIVLSDTEVPVMRRRTSPRPAPEMNQQPKVPEETYW
jgi:hypothetical protein